MITKVTTFNLFLPSRVYFFDSSSFAVDLHAGMRLREGLSVRYSSCPKVRKSLKITLCDVPMCNKQITVMKKQIFSFVSALTLVLGAVAISSCTDYESEINSLGDRVTAVEDALADLQGQIDAGAVITEVNSTEDGIEIVLSNDQTYVVKNGEDGAKGDKGDKGDQGDKGDKGDKGDQGDPGTPGTPGTVVTIGPDGYWYIDGEKTEYPATGPAGQPGQTGPAGTDAPTVYYKPDLESGLWIKVTETKGEDGEIVTKEEPTEIDWRGTYSGVTAIWDDVNGTLTIGLTDAEGKPTGETKVIYLSSALKSLAFVPEVLYDGLGVISFYDIYSPAEFNRDNTRGFITANNPQVTYRLNPENAEIADIDWSFINRDVTIATKAAGDKDDVLSIVAGPVKDNDGGLVFTLAADSETIPSDHSAAEKKVIVALRANDAKYNEEIVSDYSFVKKSDLDEFNIINKKDYEATPSQVTYFQDAAYDAAKAEVKESSYPTVGTTPDLKLLYTESIDINEYLETYAEDAQRSLPEVDVTPTYNISLVEEYLGADGKTNQQKFVTLSEDGVLSVNKSWLANPRPAIGRTPLLYVQSLVDGKIVADCFILVEITEEKAEPIGEETFVTVNETIKYVDIDPTTGETIAIDWETVNTEILAELNMSPEDFSKNYNVTGIETSYDVNLNGEYNEPIVDAKPAGVSATAGDFVGWTTTNAVELNITNKVDEKGKASVKIVIPALDNTENPDVAIVINYTITHEYDFPALNPDYLKPGTTNTVQVKGKLNDAGTAWVMQSSIKEHFTDYLAGWETPGNHNGAYWAVLQPLNAKGEPLPYGVKDETGYTKQEGVKIEDGTPDWTTAEISLDGPLTEESFTAVVTIVVQLANSHFCEMHYNVEFISPFVIELGDITLKTLTAEHSVETIDHYITIKDRDGKLIYGFEKASQKAPAFTQYAEDAYKITTASSTYDLVYNDKDNPGYDTEESFGENLSINQNQIDWYNDGATLYETKYAGYKVTTTFANICTISAIGNVTVLNSADSTK